MSTPPRRNGQGQNGRRQPPRAPPRIRRRRRRPPRRDDESKQGDDQDETKEDKDKVDHRTCKAKLDDEAVVDARENPDQEGNDKSVQPLFVTPSLLLF